MAVTGPVRIEMKADCALLSAQTVSKRLIEITVAAADAEEAVSARRRLPLNLALVIDRSGSMEGGRKLAYVKEAAIHVLGVLDERDQVAIVTYDSDVRLLSPGVAVTAERRAELTRAIRAVRTGGSTALFDGWLRGADAVAQNQKSDGINLVLLLTDGLANSGETRREVLEQHTGALFARGVSTSTFGVGTDFNQFLLEGMAERGGGAYHFIEHPDQIPALFAQELGDLLRVVVRDARLTIATPGSGGVALTLFGDLNHSTEGADCVRVPLGSLISGQERAFFLEALVPPLAATGGEKDASLILSVEVTGVTEAGESVRLHRDLRFRYAPDSETSSAPRDEPLRQRAADVQVASAQTAALRLAEEGRGKEGAKVLRSALTQLRPSLAAPAAAEAETLAEQMDREEMSPAERKRQHSLSYQKRQARK